MSNNEDEIERAVVVIRRWKNTGELIALFPGIAADFNGHISSYMIIGQHGPASPQLTDVTDPVSYDDEEVLDFIQHLRDIGYDPILRKKITGKLLDKGRYELQKLYTQQESS